MQYIRRDAPQAHYLCLLGFYHATIHRGVYNYTLDPNIAENVAQPLKNILQDI